MNREILPDGLRIFDAKGSAVIRRPRDYVEHIVAKGYAEVQAAEAIIEQRNRILRECGKIALFDDLEALSGYDSRVRLQLTQWSRENQRRIVAFHILTRSRLVAMGVTVANLAIGGSIRAHLKRESFEAALQAEVFGGGAARV